MPENTRKLAAILFADIVGYTALMQEDEAKSMQILDKFHFTLHTTVTEHQGQVVNNYGDGCLVTFDNAVNAVRCAKDLQEQFQVLPKVPVRIGIHTGDVLIKDGNAYGDAVNITSRVESMGVAGAVLLSSAVRTQIKNQTEFQLTSLGRFEFKNVEEPMEVFALANEGLTVPKREELKGKFKTPATKKARTWLWFLPILLILGGLGFYFGQKTLQAASDDFLPEQVRTERVAAIPFINNTGNTNLDAFGGLNAQVITSGLTEAGIKTVSPQTIQQYKHLIGVLPNNAEGKASFSEVVNARYWIEGYFLQQGDILTIKSQLVDGWSGEVVRNFPDAKGSINTKEQLSDQLTRRIMGYWVAREVIDRGKFKPPLYEAYQEFEKRLEKIEGIWDSGDGDIIHSRKAFELDSTFYYAILQDMFWMADRRSPRTDTIIALLEPHYDKMTTFEQLLYNSNKALYDKDWKQYAIYREQQYQLFPTDSNNDHYAFHLMVRENKPQKAWTIYNQQDLATLPEELKDLRANRAVFVGFAGLMAEEYKATSEMIDIYLKPLERANYQGLYFLYKVTALTRANQIDKVYEMIPEVKAIDKASAWVTPEFDFVDFCNQAANDLLLQGDEKEASNFLQMAIAWAYETPDRMRTIHDSLDLATTYRLLGAYEKALSLELSYLDRIEDINDNWFAKSWYVSGIGFDLASSTKEEEALKLLQEYANLSPVLMARILVAVNNKSTAMKHLQTWQEEGQSTYTPMALQYDYLLKNLFDYPPFEEFMRIKEQALAD